MAGIKKGLMLMVWRFQQINTMVLIIGLSITLTFQLYPYVRWRFYGWGISPNLDWLIILIIFLIIFACAVIVGLIYDVLLKLWIQHAVVMIERNPYAKEKIPAKQILNRKYFYIPLLKKSNLDAEVEFNEKWVERNMEDDPILRKDTERVIAWINEYKLKPADKRWLKELERLVDKPYAPKTEDVIE